MIVRTGENKMAKSKKKGKGTITIVAPCVGPRNFRFVGWFKGNKISGIVLDKVPNICLERNKIYHITALDCSVEQTTFYSGEREEHIDISVLRLIKYVIKEYRQDRREQDGE